MLIEAYDLEVFTPPCNPGSERYAARARLNTDISKLLPFLNATLRGAIFHPTANALTWKKAGHNIAFHAYEIATSNVEDREGAEKELKGLVDLVNRTWERRSEITPSSETRQRPTPMAIFKLLPQTNCKQCGEPTCYTFALKLAATQKMLSDCPPLTEEQYAENLSSLEAIILDAPAVVITVCDAAAESCPIWLGRERRIHKSFPDPAKATGSEEEIMNVFRKVRDDMVSQMLELLQSYPLLLGKN